MVQHVKDWWLTHSVWIFSVLQFLSPSINDYVHKHPGTFLGTIIPIVVARLWQGQKGGSNVPKV